MNKMTVVKVASVAGMLLGMAGTLVSSWSGQKMTDAKIAEEVDKAVKNQTN